LNRKHLFVSFVLLGLLLFSVTAYALMLIPAAGNARENAAADRSPVIDFFEGGWILNPRGLEKKVFVHYAKPPCNTNGVCEPELGENPSCSDCKNSGEEPVSSCYGFLGKGVLWKDLPQTYVIDPDSPQGLDGNFVINAISRGIEEWDSHTSTVLFSGYVIDHEASWDSEVRDGRNEFVFESYPDPNVIAVAVTWGYFTGRPSSRKILEFDVLFNTSFAWGDAALDSSVMDLQNIATHEIGHGLGLADLYTADCAEETMYGYSTEGETSKRSLEAGDITGLQELYGS